MLHGPAPLCRRQSSAWPDRGAGVRRRLRPHIQQDDQTPTAAANRPARGGHIVLDMDSSVSPTHGAQEMSVWNGHYACTCYHPLFVFNQFGDLERSALRPGNVHSADGWDGTLKPVVARYEGKVSRIYFRADAAFAMPEVYEYLEAERIKYAIRLPANQVLQGRIGYLLKRPVGRPPNEVRRCGADQGLVADESEGKADQDRREDGEPRPLCCLPDGRGRHPTANVPGDFAIDRGTTTAAATSARMRRRSSRIQKHPTGGVRPNASENSQISPSTIARAARAAGSHPHFASVLQQDRKSANISARSGVIWGIPA